jgi:pyruvate formate lyase activating enzyme
MLNAGTLDPVLNTLKILKDEGVWLEITNLVIPSWTDDLEMIKKMCDWLADNGFENTPLHFSRFHPQYKLTNLPTTPVNVLIEAKETASKAGLKFVYIGNVPGQNFNNTFCPHCHDIVIERKGYKIIQNEINNGKCGKCQNTVSGIWD